ncbi:MAG: hypothetical protein J7480_07850 [Microbacteriaceae bacterium]|nr:hypothetical protein [Microbacteriaceae bacterium]
MPAPESPSPAGLPSIEDLDGLAALVLERGPCYVRYSAGPGPDAAEQSTDYESGLPLPGLSVNPLHPEAWWTRPLRDWLARQICQYRDLQREDPERIAWVLSGRETGRGPDCEPLIADVVPLGRLSAALLDEAAAVYEARFDAGRGPEGADAADACPAAAAHEAPA